MLMLWFLADCKTFMETFTEVAESQKKKEENKDAASAAGLLEKLTVEEKATEDKAGEDVPPTGKETKPDAEKAGVEKKSEHASSS